MLSNVIDACVKNTIRLQGTNCANIFVRYRIDRSEEGIAKYRRQPLFSANHVIRRPGKIYVGQSIEAIRAPREML